MSNDLRLQLAAQRVRIADLEAELARMVATLDQVVETLSSESVINVIRQERRHRREKNHHYQAITELRRCLGTATIPATITGIEKVFAGARAVPVGAEHSVETLRQKYGRAGPSEPTIRRALSEFSNG